MKELWTLFWTFAKMGVMTFGGGMAMLPILQREVVENKHWATEEELTDYYAIGQCTPGIIAVNTATFIGQKFKGIPGGIIATLGVVFPSLVIITILAGLINNFADLAWVQNAFAGIQVCVCVLIFNATVKLLKKSVVDKPTAVIFAAGIGSAAIGDRSGEDDWSGIIFEKNADPYVSPLHYTDKPHLSGFLSAKNEGLLEGTPAVFAKKYKSGSVVVFADDMNFRSYCFGTSKMFMNAIFFGKCF